MIINDYTHKNEYNALRENYLQQSKIISGLNTDNYEKIFTKIINDGLEEKAKLNKNGLIYNILVSYATKQFKAKILRQPSQYHIPYISTTNLNGKMKIIHTPDIEIQFKLIIGNYFELVKKIITNDQLLKKLYIDLYNGNTINRCHELCAKYLQKDFNIVTAFIQDIFSDMFFLHSFQQNGNIIYDLSNNIIWNTDTFYDLVTPKIVSEIPCEQFYEDFKNNNVHGNLKDYFMNHPKQKSR